MNEAEILSLPENGGTELIDDPDNAGHLLRVPRPIHFLVRTDNVFLYHLSDGSQWTVGRAMDGRLYRQRFPRLF